MNLPITVTVDVAKATAKLSGPLVLGNTYKVTFQGLTEAQAARHPTLVILGRPQLTNQLDEGGRGVAVPTVAAMSTAAGVLALHTQEMADVFSMAGLPPQAAAERACDARKPHAVLPGEVLHGAVRPHAALALHFYVTTQGAVEVGVDTSADSNGATLAQGDCTVHWAPFEFDGAGNPIILRGPPGATGPVGPGCVAAWAGCVSFYIDFDSTSGTFGHLIACAENRGDLFHDGADGSAVGIAAKPHFVLAGAENPSVQPPESIAGQLTDGHLYAIHYGTDGDTAQCLDLGSIGGGIALATMLKNSMEDDSQDGVSARTLNETSSKVNSLWTRIKNACSALMGSASAVAIAVGAGILIGAARPAAADVAQAIGDMDPDTPVYSAAQIDARGTGFPLAEDADFAGHSATGVGSIQFAGSTNELAIIDGKLKYGGKSVSGIPNLEAGRNIELAVDTTNEVVTISTTDDVSFRDVQVRGNLTVYGQQNIQTIRRYYTNVYVGTQTNYVTTEMHTTNHQYQYLHVVTRTTNNVDEVINIGGDVDHSRAATVLSPSYSIDNHDTNAPALSATGFWDYTLASLALGTNAVSSFNGWTGAVGIQAGSNIVFGTDDANRRITINATVPEIDLSGYATAPNLSGVAARVGAVETNIANHSGGMTNYVTGPELDAKLAEYAPASEINIIADDIDEIVSALSNPVIETPDHKKWAMQGRYANGQVTHVWVPYVGLYSSPIRIPMPDGRIFEMVGSYADGNTNRITHTWEEVTE